MNNFRTYFKEKQHSEEKVHLKGLKKLTPRKLFWLAHGVAMCEKIRDEFKIVQILSDEHLPQEFRVRGPVTSIEQFSKDWNCPKGSTHNPYKRCMLW